VKTAIVAAFLFFVFCGICAAQTELAKPQDSVILEQPQPPSLFDKLRDIRKETSNKISQTVLKYRMLVKEIILKVEEIKTAVQKVKSAVAEYE
jgi:hypothetical protein